MPGGQLELDETPEQRVRREIHEETGLQVRVGLPIRTWIFEVVPSTSVLVVAYGCQLESQSSEILKSGEHTDVAFISQSRLSAIALPDGYRAAIADWR